MGIEVAHSKQGNNLSQRKFLLDIPEELLGSCCIDTPMHPNNVLRDEGYMARSSHLDIAFAVSGS